MLVLKIIAGVALLWALYRVIRSLNNKVIKKFNYEFLDKAVFSIAFISNLLIYFGQMWYFEAVERSGDVFNGILLIGFGIVGLLFIVFINIKRTNFLVGISGSVIQLSLFGVASFFAVFVIWFVVASIANARPVYNIND